MNTEMTNIHICHTESTAKEFQFVECPDCKKIHPNARRQSLHLCFFTPWYGWDRTCLCCGRTWQDGEWMRLPFSRYARNENTKRAKERWRRMPPISQNHFE